MNLEVLKQDHHRNGVGGEPFKVAIVYDHTEGVKMLVVMFPDPMYTAAFNLSKLAEENIEFGDNSYRGDRFDTVLRPILYPDTGKE